MKECIIKNSVTSKVNIVRRKCISTYRIKRQITKLKVHTTNDASTRIATRPKKENQKRVRRVRRENAKKLVAEERLAELRRNTIAEDEANHLFELIDLLIVDSEQNSSLNS
jgi:hypothetical protein